MNQLIESEYRKVPVSDLKLWDKNPKEAPKADEMQRLKEQMTKLKVYKPLLVNQDNIVLGGNHRLMILREMEIPEITCSIVQTNSEEEMIEYALSDNDNVVPYSEAKLADLVTGRTIDLTAYKINLYKTSTLEEVLQNLQDKQNAMRGEADMDTTDGKLETYLNGTIRQIVLYFSVAEYEQVLKRIEAVTPKLQAENNTSVFLKLLEAYERSTDQ